MQTKFFVHGTYVDSFSGETFPNYNPATQELLSHVAIANEKDVDRAVESARAGFEEWKRYSGAKRGQILRKASDLLRQRNEELAHLEVLDTGKPIQEALSVDVLSGADAIEYFANLAGSLHGHHLDLGSSFAYTRREPLGICAGIGAWNYPLQIACWKSAPALACGNSMIFKPSELTPLTALKLAEIYCEAGVPPGVFNVVQGPRTTGQALVRNRWIRKISLTGEISTGKKVMADAASTLKHVTMELGGKSPLIIFADCDLSNAVKAAMLANFYTQGEICSNGTRVFVEKQIYNEFVDKIIPATRKLIVGDPLDPKTQVGALISKEHTEKVLSYIGQGKSEGAKLLCGGTRAPVASHLSDNFVLPTIFTGCRDEMRIVQEEIFGPVMSLLTFEREDEVIARSNHTDYGLAAGIFTRDLKRAHRVAAELEAGICWINNYNLTPVEIPFGGTKQSGLGRENGMVTLSHYTQLKSVYIEMDDVQCSYNI